MGDTLTGERNRDGTFVKQLTDEDEKKIIERYLSGDSSTTIAKDIKYSSTCVLDVLKRNNIETGFKSKSLKEYGDKTGYKNARKIPPKEEILLRFVYLKDEGRLLHKRTLKETKPDQIGYRNCSFGVVNGKQIKYKEHRLIFFLETGKEPDEIDHIDGDKENNRISNLRAATSKENSANSRGTGKGKSKYKGVFWESKCPKRPWTSCIKSGGKSHHLGHFYTEHDAARAYNKKALELNGEFAFLNIIEEN